MPRNRTDQGVRGRMTGMECPACPHMSYQMDGYRYCSCEDCHPGGAVIWDHPEGLKVRVYDQGGRVREGSSPQPSSESPI